MSGQTAPGGAITYTDLIELAWHPGQLQQTPQAWNAFVQGIEKNVSDLDGQVTGPISTYWKGIASDLAQNAVAQTGADLTGQAAQLHKIADVLEENYSTLIQLANNLFDLHNNPCMLGSASGPLVAPFPPGTPPVPPNPADWSTNESWPLPRVLGDVFTVAPGNGGAASGTVLVQANNAAMVMKSANITQNDISFWRDAYQWEINWYVNQANAQDEAAAAELRQLGPKQAPKPKPKPKPPSDMMGGKTVTVAAWGSDPSNPTAGSLWGIAQQEYGNGNYWPLIYEANKNSFGGNWGPNDIQTGWSINVPAIKRGTPVPAPPANSGTTA
jgi:hypothetical protein